MSDQNNTLPPPDVELKFQMQAMTKMNFVYDRLEKVGKHGNMGKHRYAIEPLDRAETLPKDSRGIGACWGQVSSDTKFAKDLQYRSEQAVRILLLTSF
jgi:hypothetical protein